MGHENADLIVTTDGGIARVTLNRPHKRNALSQALMEHLAEALEAIAADGSVRVVVLTGAGDKAFSAGADISEFATLRSTPAQRTEYDAIMQRAFTALDVLPQFSIARVRGFCVGGGAEVAMDCDVMVAAESSRIGITPSRLGVGYGAHDIARLVRRVGGPHAKEILATGRLYEAAEAQAMGWITHVVADEALDGAVDDLARAVAANAPLSVRAGKRIVNEVQKDPPERDLALCERLVEDCFASEDYREGQRAFAEKRRPLFKGR